MTWRDLHASIARAGEAAEIVSKEMRGDVFHNPSLAHRGALPRLVVEGLEHADEQPSLDAEEASGVETWTETGCGIHR